MLKDIPFFARLAAGWPERLFLKVLAAMQFWVLGQHKDPQTVALLRRIRGERRSLLSAMECFLVHSLAKAQCGLPGDLAEVGCYQGCSAKLICEGKGERTLHLFDTFEGLPKSAPQDRGVHNERLYACSLESVQSYLKGYPNVHFYKGLFPDTAGPVADRTFPFVHCDVDLYESTLACLKFFYPRLSRGGILLSHDYSVLAGVKTAFTEFMADKPEKVIELPTTQCMVVKL